MSEENSNFHQLLNLRAQENLEIIEWLRKRDEKYTSQEIPNELLEAMALGADAANICKHSECDVFHDHG